MQEFNPWTMPRTEQRQETREFADGGASVAITFVALEEDILRETRVQELAEEHLRRYVTGGVVDGRRSDPYPFAAPDGQQVRLTETICRNIALMQALQPDGEGLSFDAWVGMALRLPRMFRAVIEWAIEFVPTQQLEAPGEGFPQPPGAPQYGSSPAADADTQS